jgi:tRNA U34 5-methylaminomethyl-2-thiouridine-forming methyltransferase MnmC
MRKVLEITKDGSHTISIPEMNVTYHSVHGALQESQHVFIEAGLNYYLSKASKKNLSILEMGFGTGLNTLLTRIEAEKNNLSIYYAAIEAFPLSIALVHSLNYCQLLNRLDLQEAFITQHQSEWDKTIAVTENMLLHKCNQQLQDFEHKATFDIVYFDAFAPTTQPELWTKEVFEKLFSMLSAGGLLVTYCSKGDVRRALLAAGFKVEKIPGPPGKREMLRASKEIIR